MESKGKVRMRDRLRQRFAPEHTSKQSTAVTLTSSQQVNASGSRQISCLQGPRVFWNEAVLQLPQAQQDILTSSSDSGNVDSDLASALQVINDIRSKSKSWTYTYRGHEISLRDVLSKLATIVGAFVVVGDQAGQIDPLHIGLPWAGVRLILQAVKVGLEDSAALLKGLEVSLYTAKRLEWLLELTAGVATKANTTFIEESALGLGTKIMGFLADAIKTIRMSGFRRTLEALGGMKRFEDFDKDCNTQVDRVARDVQACQFQLSTDDSRSFAASLDRLEDQMKQLEMVQEQNLSFSHKFDLSLLPVAESASFDSFAEASSGCQPGTRVELLKSIMKWAYEPTAEKIFWLRGAAGTGKSTLAKSVANTLSNKGHLAASFFFKRTEKDRNSAAKFITTLASQLAEADRAYGSEVANALDKQPSLPDKSLGIQWQRLIAGPLKLASKGTQSPQIRVIVVDALDECEQDNNIREIIRLMAETKEHYSPRFFLTSRPELPILQQFGATDKLRHHDLDLLVHTQDTVEQDIAKYIQAEFDATQLHVSNAIPPYSLPVRWLEPASITKLAGIASPLYIVAATICRQVNDYPEEAEEFLQGLLQNSTELSSQIEMSYVPVLDRFINKAEGQSLERLTRRFQSIVGTIALSLEPQSIKSLARLLDLDIAIVSGVLGKLLSVIDVPGTTFEPVRMYHLSLRDFLVTNDPPIVKRDVDRLRVVATDGHGHLLSACLRLLSEPGVLRRNILDLQSPATQRDHVSSDTMAIISPEVSYACRYWARHLLLSGQSFNESSSVYGFLKTHLLHWIEVVAWLGDLRICITASKILLASCKDSSVVTVFVDDLRHYLMRFAGIIADCPLQVYSSTLIFAPSQSIIRQTFEPDRPQWLRQLPSVPKLWGTPVQILERYESAVAECRFVDDEESLMMLHHDGSLASYEVASGRRTELLERHEVDNAQSVASPYSVAAWSPDGKIVVMCFDACNILIRPVIPIATPSRSIDIVYKQGTPISLSNQYLAAVVSTGGRIRIWDTSKDTEVREVVLNAKRIARLSFSSDSRYLIACSELGGTYSIEMNDELTVRRLEHDGFQPTYAIFTPCTTYIITVSEYGTAHLWLTATGVMIREFQRPPLRLIPVQIWEQEITTISGSGLILGLGCKTNEHRYLDIFDIGTGILLHSIQYDHDPRNRIPAIAISSDGRILARSTENRSNGRSDVELWDVKAGRLVSVIENHAAYVDKLGFSSDARLLFGRSAYIQAGPSPRVWRVPELSLPTNGQANDPLEESSPQFRPEDVAICPSGTVIAAAYSTVLKIMPIQDGIVGGSSMKEIVSREDDILSVSFSNDGICLMLCLRDKIEIYDVATMKLLNSIARLQNNITASAFFSDTSSMAALAYSTTGNGFDSSTHATELLFRYQIMVWPTLTGGPSILCESTHAGLPVIAVDRPGEVLATYDDASNLAARGAGKICTYNLETGELEQQLSTYDGSHSGLLACAFSRDSTCLASSVVCRDNTREVRLRELRTGKMLEVVKTGHFVTSLEYHSKYDCLFETGSGVVHFSTLCDDKQQLCQTQRLLSYSDNWLCWDGRPELWIPPASRPFSHHAIARSRNGRIVILQPDGILNVYN